MVKLGGWTDGTLKADLWCKGRFLTFDRKKGWKIKRRRGIRIRGGRRTRGVEDK